MIEKGRDKVKKIRKLLNRIYSLHDEFMAGLKFACRKKCAYCCACNVSMTTLEGLLIQEVLQPGQKNTIFIKLEKARSGKRYRPGVTINQLVEICKSGGEPPPEDIDPKWGSCPVINDDLCPIYQVRPFGCRAMVSRKACGTTGYADMDPFVLTVNNLFQQYIEQLDSRGFYGNFADVMYYIAGMEKLGKRITSTSDEAVSCGLIPNHPITALAVPHEHRNRIQPILEALEKCLA